MSARWKRKGVRIAFVPTMGYLHAGHLTLVKRARRLARKEGKIVVSIYVNPTQFGPKEDFSKYPRDLERDARLCRTEGVDVVFCPTDEEMYPGKQNGSYSTFVVEEQLSRSMEGASRPTHFRGVTTVVAKLFNIVQPDVAIFGAKDFQQAAVLRRMARDLNFPLRLVVAPTHREPDGLAMSSRNKYLVGELRTQAVALSQAIERGRAAVRSGKQILATQLQAELTEFIQKQPAARVDYIEFFDPETLQQVSHPKAGTQLALAVYIGNIRLIDNGTL